MGTGRVYAAAIQHKFEAASILKGLILHWRNLSGRLPQRLQSDHGGEFVTQPVQSFLADYGIAHSPSAPSPQSNGHAERMNRTFVGSMRAPMIQVQASPEFWPYALVHAASTQNRLPHSPRQSRQPISMWIDHKEPKPVSVNHIRQFGTKVFIHKSPYDKLLSKADPGIFLNHEDNEGRLCTTFNSNTNEVVTARNLVFVENISGFSPDPQMSLQDPSFHFHEVSDMDYNPPDDTTSSMPDPTALDLFHFPTKPSMPDLQSPSRAQPDSNQQSPASTSRTPPQSFTPSQRVPRLSIPSFTDIPTPTPDDTLPPAHTRIPRANRASRYPDIIVFVPAQRFI